jgi:hypothetical protein
LAEFPRTTVAGVSLPRMLIGSNWFIGYGHSTQSNDRLIAGRNANREAIADIIEAFMEYGINAVMGCASRDIVLNEGAKLAEDRTGKEVIIIDTPILNMDDTAKARRETEALIKKSREIGSTFCFPHHSSAEQLVNKNKGTMERLPDYLAMVRDNGMIPGLSAHMPELIVYSDANGYDVETYIQIYNCIGFLMQVEIEYVNKIIRDAKKPVMTIKPMAAGRVTPFVGLNFAYATLRDCDMVTVGCFTPQEVHEDVEIAMACLERRAPDLEGRGSPNKTVIMK